MPPSKLMNHNQRAYGSTGLAALFLGVITAGVFDTLAQLTLLYQVRAPGRAAAYMIEAALCAGIGATVGATMCLGRPASNVMIPVAAVAALAAQVAGDQVSLYTYWTVHHYPVTAHLFTHYFIDQTAISYATYLLTLGAAGGLTALRIAAVSKDAALQPF